MKVVVRSLKSPWDSVAFKIKDTDNEETMRRHVADRLKAKEHRAFAKKCGGEYDCRPIDRRP